MGMIENRRFYRLPFRTKFIFSCGEKVFTGNSVNISSGGIFVTILESTEVPRDSLCHCVLALAPDEAPLSIQSVVKRIVAPATDPEIVPGLAFAFVDSVQNDMERLREFMAGSRQNFELAATILASGEPDLTSLEPLIQRMHLPPTQDMGDLRFQIERILRSIELVDANNARTQAPPPPA